MTLCRLASSIAAIGLSAYAASASALPISGNIALVGLSGINSSVLIYSADPCTLANWTGLNFGALNIYGDTTGDIASFLLAGPVGGLAVMQDPVLFSSPGTLFTAGNLRYTWSSVSLSSDGVTWGASFTGTMSQVLGSTYTATPYLMSFSTQGSGASWSAQNVPLPGTLALLGLGLAGVGLLRPRRRA